MVQVSSLKTYDHRLVCVTIKLYKAKLRMLGYWKFNTSLCDENFQNQLGLILKWELMQAIIGNSLYTKFKDRIRSFAAIVEDSK